MFEPAGDYEIRISAPRLQHLEIVRDDHEIAVFLVVGKLKGLAHFAEATSADLCRPFAAEAIAEYGYRVAVDTIDFDRCRCAILADKLPPELQQ